MNHGESGMRAPLLVAGLGAVLLLAAVVAHTRELTILNSPIGPSIALLLDGLPALGLVYAGHWLSGTDLAPEGRSTVTTWCLVGATLFVAVVGATVVVRTLEGRVITEPTFVLLVATEAGGFAGFVAGYYSARARRDARRAGTANDASAFVNELIRHELRNDLTVIHGHAELIAAEDPSADTEASPGDPDVILEKTAEALARIEITRAVAETLTGDPDLEGVDLTTIAAEMAERVDDAYDASVRTDLPGSALVAANAGLRSVVDNLLENAVEHNDAENPRVTVVVRDGTDAVRLSVVDNGPGIPDEEGSPFGAGEPGSESGGLALIRRLVDEYGGDVRVEENEPRGSVFVVELPRAASEEP